MPESRVTLNRIHHIKDTVLTDGMIRSAFSIVILYIVTFFITTFVGMFAGFSFVEAAYEAASATGNVGLSIGVATPSSPSYLKITYIVVMWLARLEFVSVLTLIAGIARRITRKC